MRGTAGCPACPFAKPGFWRWRIRAVFANPASPLSPLRRHAVFAKPGFWRRRVHAVFAKPANLRPPLRHHVVFANPANASRSPPPPRPGPRDMASASRVAAPPRRFREPRRLATASVPPRRFRETRRHAVALAPPRRFRETRRHAVACAPPRRFRETRQPATASVPPRRFRETRRHAVALAPPRRFRETGAPGAVERMPAASTRDLPPALTGGASRLHSRFHAPTSASCGGAARPPAQVAALDHAAAVASHA